uniref:Uncharacterized protein n=1 Tax=Cacopsylla melanoneura TaxID=428564 RepID=A0A8D8T0C9_9HEMI
MGEGCDGVVIDVELSQVPSNIESIRVNEFQAWIEITVERLQIIATIERILSNSVQVQVSCYIERCQISQLRKRTLVQLSELVIIQVQMMKSVCYRLQMWNLRELVPVQIESFYLHTREHCVG